MSLAEEIKKKTDEEIVDFLSSAPGHSHEITAQSEIIRRLIGAIRDFNKKSSYYSKILIFLTVAITVLTLAMILK